MRFQTERGSSRDDYPADDEPVQAPAATDPERRDTRDDEPDLADQPAEGETAADERAEADRPDAEADRADPERADPERADSERADLDRADLDRADSEPAPLPTAFGATTVGAAVAASAMADHDRHDDRTSPATEDLPGDGREDGAGTPGPDRVVGVATPVPPDAVANQEPVGGRAVPLEPQASTVRVQAADRDGDPDADAPDDAESAGEPEPALPDAGPPAPVTTLWSEETVSALRDRWRDVQLRFVDDPRGAADEAQALVGEAVDALTATLAERRADLDGWRSGETGDTERLRVAVRGYRDFLDRLLGL